MAATPDFAGSQQHQAVPLEAEPDLHDAYLQRMKGFRWDAVRVGENGELAPAQRIGLTESIWARVCQGFPAHVYSGVMNGWMVWVSSEVQRNALLEQGCTIPVFTMHEVRDIAAQKGRITREDLVRMYEIKQVFSPAGVRVLMDSASPAGTSQKRLPSGFSRPEEDAGNTYARSVHEAQISDEPDEPEEAGAAAPASTSGPLI